MRYQAIEELIGKTPMLALHHLTSKASVQVYAKLEGQNPGGSVKDRLALALIEDAERKGELTRDKTILESTSGNTGIGLAMIAAVRGYRVVLTMSAGMSEERKQILRAFGAELVETDPKRGTGGAREKAHQLHAEHPDRYWMPQQHSNPANPRMHYETTAEEILQDVPDITHFIAGIGTFGTLAGVGKRLKDYNTGIKIIGVEPELGQPIQGLRNMQEEYPPELFAEHRQILDRTITVRLADSKEIAKQLARSEGLFVGISSAAAAWAAQQVAQELTTGTMVVLFPDRGEKYVSTGLYN
ncbi:MAG TPA: cysteine synthase family protein [bacterium]|nr:cysteine synthase family protein [bacterium]